MAEILGYGEDSMTLQLIQDGNKLHKLLSENALIDEAEEIITVWYRPSFGRGEWYGEFDSIIETTKNILLVECKKEGSEGCPKSGHFSLRKEQWLRHAILKYLIETWVGGNSWGAFWATHNQAFCTMFEKELPQDEDSDLVNNLMFFLNRNSRKGIDTKNILLFFGQRINPVDITLKDLNNFPEPPVFKPIIHYDASSANLPRFVPLEC
jgi:hypothetical protein